MNSLMLELMTISRGDEPAAAIMTYFGLGGVVNGQLR